MSSKVEHVFFAVTAQLHIAIRDNELVFSCHRLRDDLTVWRDNTGSAHQILTSLAAGFGHRNNPCAILIGPGLNAELVIERSSVRRFGVIGVMGWRIIADQHQLDTLKPEHAEGFGPASIIADAQPHLDVAIVPDLETIIPNLEIALLQMLEGPFGIVFAMARQMDLAVLRNDLS